MHKTASFAVVAYFCLCLFAPLEASEKREITLQLKWKHQFQFAGYYAALEKGFYEEEGLVVKIREGDPGKHATHQMLNGEADFCIAASEAIVSRMKGEPVVACAAIFQHSPYVLITNRKSRIETPEDLLGKKVVISKAGGLVQFGAMMDRRNLSLDDVEILRGAWSLDALSDGTADAISGYSTTQAPLFRTRGLTLRLIAPMDYGIDFYGDTLCTTEKFVEENREVTEAMVRASIKGWEYAMANPDEIIDLILTLPGVEGRGKSRALLESEAELTRPFVVPDLVKIGSMNTGRWSNIASIYVDSGVAQYPKNEDWMDGFVFQPRRKLTLVNLKLVGIVVVALGIIAFIVIVWNAILRRQVEAATKVIHQKSRLHQLLLDTAMDAAVGIDRDSRIVSWSRQAEKIFGAGKETAVGESISRFLPDFLAQIGKGNSSVKGLRFDQNGKRDSGEQFPVELSVSTVLGEHEIWLNIFVRDVTDQQGLEEKLRQSQKMQAVGQLAGGIAHDFNNLLTVIHGNMELLLPELGGSEKALAEEIDTASLKAAELTRQLLAFTRQQPMVTKPVRIDECIASFGKILERIIGEDIELKFDLDAEEATVEADPAMLEQVMLNLVVNSRDAMPRGGTLKVETIPSQKCGGLCESCVQIRVTDSGVGIEPERLSKIFEPFYTTKEVGEGTGLGLPTALGIIEQHGGTMEVESEKGKGTVFTIILPTMKTDVSIPGERERVGLSGRLKGGKETIFLVEDEALVRAVARKTLSRFGYHIIEAESGAEALEIWKKHHDRIDLLLTDIVMPGGVSGHELATRLQSEQPELPVICASGYSAEVFRGEIDFPERAQFLSKPYSPSDLIEMVRQSLDEVVLAG